MSDLMDSDSDVEVETSMEDQEAIMQLESMLENNPHQLKVHLKVCCPCLVESQESLLLVMPPSPLKICPKYLPAPFRCCSILPCFATASCLSAFGVPESPCGSCTLLAWSSGRSGSAMRPHLSRTS